MSIGHKLSIAILAAALGGLIIPAFAQNGTAGSGDQGMSMGHMGRGMMGGGMMSRGMMAGCSEMMQSMNNGDDGRPNGQWQKHPPHNPQNGG
jgi:hypothetical protein